jgi:AbrB family looped-hinge helix DNA binding protein
MPVATITSKGQITLPLAVRNGLGLSAGNQVDFIAMDGSFMVVPVRSDVTTLRGRFAGRVKKPVSIDAMNEAIADGAAARNLARRK